MGEKAEEDFMSTNFETIVFEEADGIGLLKVNRPDKLNALNQQVLTELKSLLSELKDNKSLKGLILTGEGEKAFIAGADIAEMANMSIEQSKDFGRLGQAVTLLFEQLPFPVIAAVNGFALGGGMEMAMACDFIFAIDTAVFGQPEVKLGLIPGFGGTQRLSRYVGRPWARELIYTGRNVQVAEAKALGLVLQNFSSREELLEAAKNKIRECAKNSPNAIGYSKRAINEGTDLTLDQGLETELGFFADIFGSDEMKEGTSAFVEKRKPNFK